MMAQDMGERVGSKDQNIQNKIFLGPKVLAKGTKMEPGGRGGSSLFSGLPLHPPPLPSSGTNMCPQLRFLIPQGSSLTPSLSLVGGWRGLEKGRVFSRRAPPAHADSS